MEVTKYNILQHFYKQYPHPLSHEYLQKTFKLPKEVEIEILLELWDEGKLQWLRDKYRMSEKHYAIMKGIKDGTLEFGADSTHD